MESNQKQLLIIYHHPCFDGAFGGANVYLFYSMLSPKQYAINFHPLKNNEWIFSETITQADKIVIVDVDISKAGFDLLLQQKKADILLFDHHLTFITSFNKETLPLFKQAGYNNTDSNKKIKAVFDESNKQSGCGLALRYYKDKALRKGCDKDTLERVFNENWEVVNQYIEDSDTGQNLLKNTEEFKSGLCSEFHQKLHSFDFSNRSNVKYSIQKLLSVNVKFTISSGEKSLRNHKKKARSELTREKTFLFNLTHSTEESWSFLIQITQHKQYRNYNAPLLAKVSQMNGFSPIGGYLYYDNFGVCS